MVPNLLPFEFLAAFKLLKGQQVAQVKQRNRQLALRIRATDRKRLVIDACGEPRSDALHVIDIRTA